jgi:hypothetical protein
MKILVAGYFNRGNLGDDAFIHTWSNSKILETFKELFPKEDISIKFKSIDDIAEEKADFLILGGGDIINDYFLRKIEKFIDMNPDVPIYGMSVGGISQAWKGEDTFLDFYDRIAFRDQKNKEIATKRFPEYYSSVQKDLVFALPMDSALKRDEYKPLQNIAFYPTRPLIQQPQVYEQLKHCLANQFTNLLQEGKNLTFVCFNTDPLNPDENDLLMCKEIIALIPESMWSQIILYEAKNPNDTLKYISENIDFGICMRFHSHVFHLKLGIPFMSICQTDKVHRLLFDLNLNQFCFEIKKDKFPFDEQELIKTISFTMQMSATLFNLLKIMDLDYTKVEKDYCDLLKSWLIQDYIPNEKRAPFFQKRIVCPVYCNEQRLVSKINQICDHLSNLFMLRFGFQRDDRRLKRGLSGLFSGLVGSFDEFLYSFRNMTQSIYPDFQLPHLDKDAKDALSYQMSEIISFCITNDFCSVLDMEFKTIC